MTQRGFHRKEKIRISLLSALAFSAIWPLDNSLRFKMVNYNPEIQPAIYAIWHGWQYGLLSFKDKKRLHLLVSESNDGEVIANVSKLLGYSLIRGSIGRGGVRALKKIIRTLKSGEDIAYTVDGPKGPLHKVKSGIIQIAQMAKAPIIPMTPALKWVTPYEKSWDKYQIPHFLSKSVIVFGDPIYVPPDISEEEQENYRLMLENKLFELRDQAENLIH